MPPLNEIRPNFSTDIKEFFSITYSNQTPNYYKHNQNKKIHRFFWKHVILEEHSFAEISQFTTSQIQAAVASEQRIYLLNFFIRHEKEVLQRWEDFLDYFMADKKDLGIPNPTLKSLERWETSVQVKIRNQALRRSKINEKQTIDANEEKNHLNKPNILTHAFVLDLLKNTSPPVIEKIPENLPPKNNHKRYRSSLYQITSEQLDFSKLPFARVENARTVFTLPPLLGHSTPANTAFNPLSIQSLPAAFFHQSISSTLNDDNDTQILPPKKAPYQGN